MQADEIRRHGNRGAGGTDPAAHRGSTVVLFFHAGWCPTCKRAEKNIESEAVPAGLTIVKTDFDSSDDLRQQYGVTVQHTFVQISPDGSTLAKFTGSDTAAEILGKTV